MITNRSLVLCLLVELSLGASLRATEQGNEPEYCDSTLVGNGLCDEACNVADFNFDDGDCVDCNDDCLVCEYGYVLVGIECKKVCMPEQINDGSCDPECNTEEFEFDGFDCVIAEPLVIIFVCRATYINNGHCDPGCNTEEYNFDGGDCVASQSSPAEPGERGGV